MLPVAHFIDVAVTPAGDAWFLAERDRRTEVVHLAPDGALAEEDVTADAGIAVAASATDVWVATAKAVWHRGADGVWGPTALDGPPRWITAIGPGRALVQAAAYEGSDVRIVEATGAQPVVHLGNRLERAVPDGIGGAWAGIVDGIDPIGLAHLTAAGDWEEWSLRAAAYDHMQVRGAPAGFAPLVPRGDGGVIATRPDAFVVLDAAGAVRETLPRGALPKVAAAHVVTMGFRKDGRNPQATGFARIPARVDGADLQFMFATGATFRLLKDVAPRFGEPVTSEHAGSFIAASHLQDWHARHPDWPYIAYGDAGAAMIQVPDMEIAGWHTGPVWFSSRKDRTFHEAIATLVDRPLDGALGGNAFATFRITADYPSGKLAFEQLGKSGG